MKVNLYTENKDIYKIVYDYEISEVSGTHLEIDNKLDVLFIRIMKIQIFVLDNSHESS